MGLFINKSSHHGLFKGDLPVNEPNQSYFKSDYVKELLEEHHKFNESFQQSVKSLRISLQKHRYQQDKRWNDVIGDINEIKESNKQHVEFESKTREWMKMLERNSQELHRIVQGNQSVNQDILKEINTIHQSNEQIMQQLKNFDAMNEQFVDKIDEMVDKQNVMADQVASQHEKQDKLVQQLESQEALMEKSHMQLSNLRSIIYERTDFIVGKIEEHYKLISAALTRFFTGSDQYKEMVITKQEKKQS